jgi:hypothetical protein
LAAGFAAAGAAGLAVACVFAAVGFDFAADDFSGAGDVTGRGFDFNSWINFVRSLPTRLNSAHPQNADAIIRK